MESDEMKRFLNSCGLLDDKVSEYLVIFQEKQIGKEDLPSLSMDRLRSLGVSDVLDVLKILRGAKSHAQVREGGRELAAARRENVGTKSAPGGWEAREPNSKESTIKLGSRGRTPVENRSAEEEDSSSSSSEEEEEFAIVKRDDMKSSFPGLPLSTIRESGKKKERPLSVIDVFRLHNGSKRSSTPSMSPLDVTPNVSNSPSMRRLQDKKTKRLTMSELAAPLTPEFSRRLLTDPARADYFRRFLESEHADENMLFYTAVEAYRSIDDPGDRLQKAVEICNTFVVESAPLQINIPMRLRDPVLELMNSYESPQRNFYNELQLHVYDMLRHDSFARFSKSVFYDLMIKGYELRALTFNPAIFDTFIALCESTDAAAWDAKPSKDGYESWMWRLGDINQSMVVKSRMRINASPPDIMAVVTDPRQKVIYDDHLVKCERVQEFDGTFRILYMLFKSPSITVKDRDAVIGMLTREKDGVCVCVSRSVPSVDHPPVKGTIRVDVESSGYLISPDGQGGSIVTYINQVNYRGKVPTRIAQKVAKKRLRNVYDLAQYMEAAGN